MSTSPLSPEQLSSGLPDRVFAIITTQYGPVVADWAARGAGAFRRQLLDVGGLPHRFITDQYAGALGYAQPEVATLGDVLDVLHVSFDLADNIADRDADLDQGHSYLSECAGVPLGVLTYLPAILASRATDLIYERFSGAKFAPRSAVARLSSAIGAMVRGQAEPSGAPARIELLSGEQGLLLCLPFWLLPEGAPGLPCTVQAFERWAYEFGRTWELGQVYRGARSVASHGAWMTAIRRAREHWPSFGPFGIDGPLGQHAVFPTCLC